MENSEVLLKGFLEKKVSGVSFKSASAVIELANDGGTVPFIARYRKEKTGNLDEVEIRQVLDAKSEFEELTKRKAFILKELEDQKNLTSDIKSLVDKCWDLGELEEIYRPYKKKKKTKAAIAREAGLEPLANWIWDIGHGAIKSETTMEVKAKEYLNLNAGIVSYEIALKGASDIIVEKISAQKQLRDSVAEYLWKYGKLYAKRTKDFKPNSKFEMYQAYEELIKSLAEKRNSHRYLAIRRGWTEEELTVDIKGEEEIMLKSFISFATREDQSPIGIYLCQCARTALQLHVLPSVVNECHRKLKEVAEEESIKVFAENVRRVLLASPYGAKSVLGVDPGLRTGCKVALVDKVGSYISHTVVQVIGEGSLEKSKVLFAEVFKTISLEAIAIGNGTAGRQAEVFFRKMVKDLNLDIPVIMVSESGASVYSASDLAREELGDLDITVRGAVSIARRLQDPLSELVKVDPKSIGVGQYQHDVNQTHLKKSLDEVVESCVNAVGVDVNTASESLLQFVSGIGPVLAKNIVEYRKKSAFPDRNELLKVSRFTPKVFEQAAGFLRIPNGRMVLDRTGIHPERYSAVRDMATEVGISLTDLIGGGSKKMLPIREKWSSLIGEFTFDDIIKELEKPGRDPRDIFKVFQFRDDIFEPKDLKPDMICPGIVSNVTNFGAFVDIGVHQDGLVHISELSDKFIDDPRKVVNPGDQVKVRVLKVDTDKNQISLSMKLQPAVKEEYQQNDRPRENARRPQGQNKNNSQTSMRTGANGEKEQRANLNQRGPAFNKSGGNNNPRGTDNRNQKQEFNSGGNNAQQKPQSNKPAFNNPFAGLAGLRK
jgi:uncharacterized protein